MKKAIVIGAGFGGIAAAIRLKKKGYDVEIIDRCNNLGGRAQVFNVNGFRHDAGPTLITAPFLFEELFQLFNKDIKEYLNFVPLNPWYRFIFDDSSIFDYEQSLNKTIENINLFSSDDALNYPKMLKASKDIYNIAFNKLSDVPFHSFLFMCKQIPSLLKFRSHRSVYSFVSQFIKNEKLRRAFSIPPLLVGGNPFTTTCIYSLIHYLERAHGVFFVMGGTGKIVLELGRLLNSIGVNIRLNTTIEKIKFDNLKINEIIDNYGKSHKADVYISNMDPLYLYKNLINKKSNSSLYFKKKFSKTSMGLFVLFFGTKRKYNNIKHHTIIFGKEYKVLLEKIFNGNELPNDISIYLHRPTATDKSFAPKNCDSFYALVPVPNLKSDIDWKKNSNIFKDHIIEILSKKVLPGLKKNIVDEFFMSPQDFQNDYLSHQGSGFSVAPYFTQSAWFRFHNKSETIKNLYLVGAGTHPGAGIPGVLSSAKVIERII
ncbi:MAG: phytoene dehydrogenase [Pelagibacterales bacterium]|nr:phytoene dehydrogenase [Pelagibacterales bacterium]OUU63342.1 MAG: phytoene dehydrogenase [Alphaproteobacteria bacterium TMED62]|tara:strand:- start:1263 stop:2720 length:1458 start_codon:yes stop_codon:yes gene_type:complete